MIVVDSHSDLVEATNGGIGKENVSRSVPGQIQTQRESCVKTMTRNLSGSLYEALKERMETDKADYGHVVGVAMDASLDDTDKD
jgi:hypothetical protein